MNKSDIPPAAKAKVLFKAYSAILSWSIPQEKAIPTNETADSQVVSDQLMKEVAHNDDAAQHNNVHILPLDGRFEKTTKGVL